MKLSDIVKQYREEHGLSQREFAKHCDLSNSLIANVERELNTAGKPFTPSFETIQKIANGMGLSASDILHQMDNVEIYISPVDEIRDELKDNMELRMLLSAASDLKKDDLKAVTDMIKRIKRSYTD